MVTVRASLAASASAGCPHLTSSWQGKSRASAVNLGTSIILTEAPLELLPQKNWSANCSCGPGGAQQTFNLACLDSLKLQIKLAMPRLVEKGN